MKIPVTKGNSCERNKIPVMKGYPVPGRNFLPHQENSFHKKDIPAMRGNSRQRKVIPVAVSHEGNSCTPGKFLSHEEHFCHRKKILSQEGITCHKK